MRTNLYTIISRVLISHNIIDIFDCLGSMACKIKSAAFRFDLLVYVGVAMFNLRLIFLCIALSLAALTFYYKEILQDSGVVETETRYVFDIGSSSLKVKGYIVDKNRGAIISILPAYNKRIGLKTCMLRSADGVTLAQECLDNAIDAILAIQSFYHINCKTAQCLGIATSWGRGAKNIDAVLSVFRDKGHLSVAVLSHEQEADLARKAVEMKLQENNRKLAKNDLVFDIGGGSFQLIGEKMTVLGEYGIDSLTEQLQNAFLQNKNKFVACGSIMDISKRLQQEVRDTIERSNITMADVLNTNLRVFGISRFLRNGLREDLEIAENIVHMNDLMDFNNAVCGTSHKNMGKMFPKITDPAYIPSMQAGVFLVEAVMKALNIEKLEILEADLQDYIAIDHKLWPADVVHIINGPAELVSVSR